MSLKSKRTLKRISPSLSRNPRRSLIDMRNLRPPLSHRSTSYFKYPKGHSSFRNIPKKYKSKKDLEGQIFMALEAELERRLTPGVITSVINRDLLSGIKSIIYDKSSSGIYQVIYVNGLGLYYNNLPLIFKGYISKGTFGIVLQFGTEKILPEYYNFAIKIFKYKGDREISIFNWPSYTKNYFKMCGIVPSNIIEVEGEWLNRYIEEEGVSRFIAVQPLMDGTLDDFINKYKPLPYRLCFDIIKFLAGKLECLEKHKLAYTDLKSSNILYQLYDNKLNIYIGDIGSICKHGERNVSSYPHPLDNDKGGMCDKDTMLWGLGVILVDLVRGHGFIRGSDKGFINKLWNLKLPPEEAKEKVKELRMKYINYDADINKNIRVYLPGANQERDGYFTIIQLIDLFFDIQNDRFAGAERRGYERDYNRDKVLTLWNLSEMVIYEDYHSPTDYSSSEEEY